MADPLPAPQLPHHLRPITPTFARRGEFMPVEGGRLMVTLPGEIVESAVVEVLDKDVAVVRIVGMVVDKVGHGFKKDSVVVVQRVDNGLQEIWEHISDREIRERAAVEDAKEAIARRHAREAVEAMAAQEHETLRAEAAEAAEEAGAEAAARVPRGTEPFQSTAPVAAKKRAKPAKPAKPKARRGAAT